MAINVAVIGVMSEVGTFLLVVLPLFEINIPLPQFELNSLAPRRFATLRTKLDIQMLPTFIQTIGGSDMIPAVMTPATTSIIPGKVGALLVDSDAAMCFALREETESASGLAVFTSASPRTITTLLMTGAGILTQ